MAILEPGVAEVLQGQRFLVWKEMLQSINYSDMCVVDEFCAGSKLTGQTELTNLWPSKVTPATMTEGELHSQAKLSCKGMAFHKGRLFSSIQKLHIPFGTRHYRKLPVEKQKDLLT